MTATAKDAVVVDPAVTRMQEMIAANKPHMAALLGKHVSVDRLFQIALLAMSRNPKLAQCTTASVLGCVMESARMRLPCGVGPGGTWLIPFENKKAGIIECTLIVDYRAKVVMMKRDAGVDVVVAEKVCKNDKFDYGISAKGPYLDWTPAKGDRGPIIGYVAASWDKEGRLTTGAVYKTVEEINVENRKKSMAAQKGEGPWVTDPDWMYKKSVINPLSKLNPGIESDDLARAVALEERLETGLPQNLHLLADSTAKPLPEGEPAKDYVAPPMTKKGESDAAAKVAWFREHTAKQGVPAEQFEEWAKQYKDDESRAAAGKAAWTLVTKKEKTAAEAFAVSKKEAEEKAAESEATFRPTSIATSDLNGDDSYYAIKDDAEEPVKYFSKDPEIIAYAKEQKSSGGTMSVAYTDCKVGKKTVRIITRRTAAK